MLAVPQWETIVRLTGFLLTLAILTAAEGIGPRRSRTVGRGKRWPGNLGLVAIDTAIIRAMPFFSAVATAGLVDARGWGLLRAMEPMPTWIGVVLAVILLDLTIYLQHRLFHALPALWMLHRVHHTDPDLDVTTGVRFHPAEVLLSAGIKVVAVSVLGAPVVGVIVFEILLNAGSLFGHANICIPKLMDRWLRMVVVTPDMHRIHHSVDQIETDRNFGFTLSWWDRLFGTYQVQPKMGHLAMTIGVMGIDTRDTLSLRRLLIQPWRRQERYPPDTRDPRRPTTLSARG